ncbi:hypothetical protein SAMN05216276_101172, partial [Streptosporangium subroseum]
MPSPDFGSWFPLGRHIFTPSSDATPSPDRSTPKKPMPARRYVIALAAGFTALTVASITVGIVSSGGDSLSQTAASAALIGAQQTGDPLPSAAPDDGLSEDATVATETIEPSDAPETAPPQATAEASATPDDTAAPDDTATPDESSTPDDPAPSDDPSTPDDPAPSDTATPDDPTPSDDPSTPDDPTTPPNDPSPSDTATPGDPTPSDDPSTPDDPTTPPNDPT